MEINNMSTQDTNSPDTSNCNESDDDESQCRKPCDPDTNCPECAGYWERMSMEGYWDMNRHRWTDKGWHEITRLI